jgi:hypothetical protein
VRAGGGGRRGRALAGDDSFPRVQSDGRTPLHTASHGGHVELVKALVEKGADVNAKTEVRISAAPAFERPPFNDLDMNETGIGGRGGQILDRSCHAQRRSVFHHGDRLSVPLSRHTSEPYRDSCAACASLSQTAEHRFTPPWQTHTRARARARRGRPSSLNSLWNPFSCGPLPVGLPGPGSPLDEALPTRAPGAPKSPGS